MDLNKYPELRAFFDASGEYQSGRANLDVGGAWLVFRPERKINSAVYFHDLNAIVIPLGWKATMVSDAQWEYARTVSFGGYAPMIYHVLVKYSANLVNIDWNREFTRPEVKP